MRRRASSLLGLVLVGCSSTPNLIFIELPDAPPTAASAILVFQPKAAPPFSVTIDLVEPSSLRLELDSFDGTQIYSLFYPCSLDALEMPSGRVGLSENGRALPPSELVLASSHSNGSQTAWATSELPSALAKLRLSLPAVDRSSLLAPCLLPEQVGAPVTLPPAPSELGVNLRWISALGGDEILTMTRFGELLRGTPDQMERIALTGLEVSDGAVSEDQIWWVIDSRGRVYSGDLNGDFIPRGQTRTASIAGGSDRDDHLVVAKDGSEVYVYSEERVLERCVPSAPSAACDWEVLGSTDPGTGDYLGLVHLGVGHVIAVAESSPMIEYRDGLARDRQVFAADTVHAVGDGVPELGTVLVGIAGSVAYRSNLADTDWIVDDPRFREAANTFQSRFVESTRRGFIFGGIQGLVREYDPPEGFCPPTRIGAGTTDLIRAARSETGYWFIAHRGDDRLYFVPAKAPSCLETSSL